MRELVDRRRQWLEAFGWSLSLIGLLSFAHFAWMSVLRDGGFAYDLHAYLVAERLAIGCVAVAIAVRWRADWLAFTAAAVAVPTLWVARFAALAGVPRLLLDDPVRRAGADAVEGGSTRT